jgi:hypothetical protein
MSGAAMTKPYSRRDFLGVALAAGVLPILPAAVHAASPAPKHLVGVDQRGKFPAGADPYVLGESANTITTYGYDPVTNMPESKVTLCQITAA